MCPVSPRTPTPSLTLFIVLLLLKFEAVLGPATDWTLAEQSDPLGSLQRGGCLDDLNL